ncbi:hypothetical protein GGR57DRAFT_360146 [Xylariaceae sp. FL1272]|nr:hypothetical protein GGR57DRAFT_360146 [Xylariaceae sp. FL1272]
MRMDVGVCSRRRWWCCWCLLLSRHGHRHRALSDSVRREKKGQGGAGQLLSGCHAHATVHYPKYLMTVDVLVDAGAAGSGGAAAAVAEEPGSPGPCTHDYREGKERKAERRTGQAWGAKAMSHLGTGSAHDSDASWSARVYRTQLDFFLGLWNASLVRSQTRRSKCRPTML